MGRKNLYTTLVNGDTINTTDATALRMPTVPTAILYTADLTTNYVKINTVPGPVNKIVLTLTGLSLTVANATQGVGIKLLDFPLGLFRILSSSASLTFTTTSILANTLNASSTLNWMLGTVTHSLPTATTTTDAVDSANAESDILPMVTAVSSATISVANTTTYGQNTVPVLLNGATTAPDIYLNVSIPAGNDIDADATVTVTGTITLLFEDLGVSSTLTAPSRMPTASFWANCPWDAIVAGKVDGLVHFNDFVGMYSQATNVAAAATTLTSPWSAFTGNDAGNTITQSTSAPYGTMVLLSTVEHIQTNACLGSSRSLAGDFVFEAGRRLWFECQVKFSTVTDSKTNTFIGFASEALTGDNAILADAGTLADIDVIGFRAIEGDGNALDLVYGTNGDGVSGKTALTEKGVIVANTYTKLGIYCDGTTIHFYQDGTELGSVALSAAYVPDGEEMCLYFLISSAVAAAGEANTITVDWVKIAQQRA